MLKAPGRRGGGGGGAVRVVMTGENCREAEAEKRPNGECVSGRGRAKMVEERWRRQMHVGNARTSHAARHRKKTETKNCSSGGAEVSGW